MFFELKPVHTTSTTLLWMENIIIITNIIVHNTSIIGEPKSIYK